MVALQSKLLLGDQTDIHILAHLEFFIKNHI